jgi:hypothetical protein
MFGVLFARLEAVAKIFRFHYFMLLIIHDKILTTILLHSIENIKTIQRSPLFSPQLRNVNAKGKNYKVEVVSMSRMLDTKLHLGTWLLNLCKYQYFYVYYWM